MHLGSTEIWWSAGRMAKAQLQGLSGKCWGSVSEVIIPTDEMGRTSLSLLNAFISLNSSNEGKYSMILSRTRKLNLVHCGFYFWQVLDNMPLLKVLFTFGKF